MSNGATNGFKNIDCAKKDDVNNADQNIISDSTKGGGLSSVIQGVQNGVRITATLGGVISGDPDEQNDGHGKFGQSLSGTSNEVNNETFGDNSNDMNTTFGNNEINCGRFEGKNIF